MFLCCFHQNFYGKLEKNDGEDQTRHASSHLATSSHQQDWSAPDETTDVFDDDDPWPEEETGKEVLVPDRGGKDVTFPATFEFLPMISKLFWFTSEPSEPLFDTREITSAPCVDDA